MTNEKILNELKRIELEKHIRVVAKTGDTDGNNYHATLDGMHIMATFYAGENGTRVEDAEKNLLYQSLGYGQTVVHLVASQWIYTVIDESKRITAERITAERERKRNVSESPFIVENGFQFQPV